MPPPSLPLRVAVVIGREKLFFVSRVSSQDIEINSFKIQTKKIAEEAKLQWIGLFSFNSRYYSFTRSLEKWATVHIYHDWLTDDPFISLLIVVLLGVS